MERDYLEELRSNLCDCASEVTLAYNTRDSDRLEAAIFHLDVERLTALSFREYREACSSYPPTEEAMDGDEVTD
jgi:hypothetical protein